MSILSCIAKLVADGDIDAARGEAFRKAFADLKETYGKRFGEAEADTMASRQLVNQLETKALTDKRQQLLQLKVQKSILERLDAAAKEKWGTLYRTARAFFSRMEGVNGVTDLDLRAKAVSDRAWSMTNDFLGKVHRDLMGHINNPALLDNVMRELFGEHTKDAQAKELAGALSHTAEWLRQQFNLHGGAIAKLDGWGWAQAHNSLLIRKAGFAAWRDTITPLLDRTRMVEGETGAPFTDHGFGVMLRQVYDHIRTDSMDRMVAGEMGGAKLGNSRSDHRFFVFKDADSWMEYQRKFGSNPFDAITGHIDGMARDVGAMQVLGPNPSYTVRWLQDVLRQDASMRGSDRDVVRAEKAAHDIQSMWHYFSGQDQRPINPAVSTAFATVRNLNAASKLGGAAITGGADLGFTHAMANYNGLNATRLIANFVGNLNPASNADRALARSAGIIAQDYAQRAIDLTGGYDRIAKANEVARRLNSAVMRVSGLHTLTSAGASAITKEWMMTLAENAGKGFGDLAEPLQRGLARYGLDGANWDALRGATQYEHSTAMGSVKLIRPEEVGARTDIDPRLADETATRYLEMIEGEKRFGMPDAGASLRAKSMLDWGAGKRGTIIGELLHSASQFKQFPVSVIDRSLQRAIYGDGTKLTRAKFVANAVIATTTMGALIIQAKNVANGKDPEPMTSPAFWARAAMQAGALGIYGDFLKDQLVFPGSGQKMARDTKTLGDLFVGPTISGVADPIMRLLLHDTSLAATNEIENNEKPSNTGREAVQFLRENLPGSNLWYARTALNRMIFDKLQTMADPNAGGAFDRMQQRADEQDHARYWWAPGSTAPDRAPDISNAVADAPQ